MRLYEYRMSLGDTIIQHVAKVKNMAAQLLDVDKPVSDLTIMAKILARLSPKYAAFQTAWDIQRITRPVFDPVSKKVSVSGDIVFIYNIPRDRYIAGNFFEQS
jgi:hypothetical protein